MEKKASMAGDGSELTYVQITKERRQTRPLALVVDGLPGLNAMIDDFLRLSSFQGQEGISQPYQFHLELRANDLESLEASQVEQLIAFDTVDAMGLWSSVRISQPWVEDRFTQSPLDNSPDWENTTPSRFFHGVVTSMSMAAPGVYQMTIGSPLHFLTLRNRYHIYANCTIPTLISEVLQPETQSGKLKLSLKFDDSPTLTRYQDWLQAGESDFAFLQRVMGRAAIHFYFIHEEEQLTLVFSNQTTTMTQVMIPNTSVTPLPLRYSYTSQPKTGALQNDLFQDLNYEVKLVQSTVDAILTREQAQWEDNTVAGFDSYGVMDSESPEYLLHHRYAYGTSQNEAIGQLTKAKQGIATDQGTLSGTVTTPLLSPGYTFLLTQPEASSVNVERLMRQSFSDRTFVVTSIQHKASDTAPYTGTVQATEVNPDSGGETATFLTPFSMENTQQGSVLAIVRETAVPRGWRYREKSNFQNEKSFTKFEGNQEQEVGCLVTFATANDPQDMVWVRLGQTTQTAPDVNAMVVVSRANNDSELPEINVLASHGSKTIMPADRRNESWTANTSWGSSYSTSYGDGISIRYGYHSPVNFDQAKTIVESAYDNPDMLGNQYDNSSFSRGGSFSVSVSDQDADGVISAGVSAGSSFNENHAKVSYGYSDTGTSQNYSQVGKSVSVSVVGDYDGSVDLTSPNFINGKVPDQNIIDIADALNEGDTYNQNHVKGRSISLSGSGTTPPSFGGTSATVYSNSATLGNTESKSKHTGNADNNSTHIGKAESYSKHIGDSQNTSIQLGDSLNNSVNIGNSLATNTQIGNTSSINTFLGSKTDISTTLAATSSLSTNIGMTNQVDTFLGIKNNVSTQLSLSSSINTNIGASSSVNTNISASDTVETNIGAKSSVSTNISASNAVATNISASNSVTTNIGASSAVTTNISASNNVSTTIGVSNNTETYIGAKNSTSTFIGATNEDSVKLSASNSSAVSIGASMSSAVNIGANISSSTSLALNMESKFSAGINIKDETSATIDIDMNTVPTKIKPSRPTIEITIESGPNINMLVMEINM
ncbi:contractile injection system protein, VgrG/Pvc8 family [Algicola sagamiensis]|uniref:contractile injection system protein, VgrG/Pvc8 family n=1 Tax=Algicola sagamiensis TaxID=163869 RepID=UPI000362AD5E|nr:contractile injection system protein, VgrG/Pvc8 family [Algicola sagamiensis]